LQKKLYFVKPFQKQLVRDFEIFWKFLREQPSPVTVNLLHMCRSSFQLLYLKKQDNFLVFFRKRYSIPAIETSVSLVSIAGIHYARFNENID